ncbi:acyl carrier protein [Aldersonia sp. NBC_00410]|uniref:acyl carrier protein n=1 Tax=Aldersonia sp. NBC_00410 TaxID=2975954 RepID=UPI00224FE90A|nr:acyl carrier protein [Aldersonia sp. NBC_00410]MCX5041646.1 acyl carrier protein [Aldersonia sp. NBC_00410]
MERDGIETDVIELVISLAPDRHGTSTAASSLVDDLGYDSARLIELTAVLEQYFGCSLIDTQRDDPPATVGDVADLVSDSIAQQRNSA